MIRDDSDERDDSRPISEQASRWWVRLHSENASPADHREFGEWVSRSPERIAAWLQTEQLMRALKSDEVRWPDTPAEVLIREARAAPAEVAPLPRAHLSPPPDAHGRRRTWLRTVSVAGVAAAVVAAVAIGWLVLQGPQQYRTALGEQYSVVLKDGSLVTLNTASRIEVDLQEDRRLVRLLAGEALFEVAHDKTRPFDVIAGNTTVRAVGTQFNIDRRATRTTVTVIEGKVAVAPLPARLSTAPALDDRSSKPTAGSGAVSVHDVPIYLSAAERLVIEGSTISAPQPVLNLAAATAWTQRRLVFERRPLGEVAEEFNRYNRQAIEIDSPELRRQEVTGVFQANDPESFITFLSNIPGVSIRRTDDVAHVVAAQEPDLQ